MMLFTTWVEGEAQLNELTRFRLLFSDSLPFQRIARRFFFDGDDLRLWGSPFSENDRPEGLDESELSPIWGVS